MILFLQIDRTESKPVESVSRFDDRESLLFYLGFDKDGCNLAGATEQDIADGLYENDNPGNFDEDEIEELLERGVVYRDKREIYQMIELN